MPHQLFIDSTGDRQALINGNSLEDDSDRAVENPDEGLTFGRSAVPNVENKPLTKLYKRRWYLLLLYAIYSCWQAGVYNTWGPLEDSVKAAYPNTWRDSTVALQVDWGVITYIIGFVPICWLAISYGLRSAILAGATMTAIGTGLRCLSPDPIPFLWLVNVCSILNGFAGVCACAMVPAFSSVWFPNHQRTTATGVVVNLNQLGIALSFFWGNWLVPVRKNHHFSSKFINLWMKEDEAVSSAIVPSDPDLHERDVIQHFMLLQFIVSAILCLLIALYFPDKPKLPPSLSSNVQRLELLASSKQILRKREGLMLILIMTLSQGVLSSWVSVLNINVSVLNVNQHVSDWLGVVSVCSQAVCGMVASAIFDHLHRHLKSAIMILLSVSTIFYAMFTLLCLKIIPFSTWMLFGSVILATSLNYAAYPLTLELAAEVLYPSDENAVGGWLTAALNLFGFLFFTAFFIPKIGVLWINYTQLGTLLISLPLLYYFKADLRRSQEDESLQSQSVTRAAS